ncbi:MAG: RnfABCDGE type electron transport complex subunit D [Candidatus Faecousia sp.]|nr:RnfABCDGE type electron transport complex subunit D [Candidatus Faecousia sp.]
MNENQLALSSSPHIHGKKTTRSIMGDVCIALLPALAGAVYFFGLRALVVTLLSCAACVFFEWGYRKLMKLDSTVDDLSAVVTGMLIAFVCPVTIPYWALIVGDFFAIIVVKQLFGGIGKNFVNPALAARAFLMLAWPALMTVWVPSMSHVSILSGNSAVPDAVTAATPLAAMHTGALPEASLLELFLGRTGGCLGETSALLLLAGGIYLVVRKVISPRIPLVFLGTVALVAFLFPQGGASGLQWVACSLLSGGVMLGAIFMATDYATSPVTPWGQVCFAVGCGLITMFIRYFGAYPEGVSYAILVMNVCTMLFDRIGRPRRFGLRKKKGGVKA